MNGYESIVGAGYDEIAEGLGQAAGARQAPFSMSQPMAAQLMALFNNAQVQQAVAPTAPAAPSGGCAPATYQGGPGMAYGGNPRVVQRQYTDMRNWPLGFGVTNVGAAAVADIISNPQVTFRGERLLIPTAVASNFVLLDVKIGQRSQFVNSLAMPAQGFTEVGVGIRLSMDTAQIAQNISLSVQNLFGTTTVAFTAMLIGTAAY